MVKKKEIEWVSVKCPLCGKDNTMPITAGVYVVCSSCGKGWYTEGIEVYDRDGSTVYKDLERQRREEIEASRERD